ncbi:Bardet-Biedl syndrome 12 protein [Hippoglossus stenolepis]|uniref:Bardet-Biedl syndrome 12 protein n=1 Tax=Hippoglossus stenolepis TaxID=195615 RepID=UPI001FAF9B7B|nr:Bardet-Biedl syndrome 12 protein [Hippoglossus stenolepis]
MLRSTVINPRQPVGLQELAALAAVAHSTLGPNKRYKFIQDDTSGESALVCSCFRILENLELTSAVGQLVYETVQAQQKVFNTGSGCLLFLAGAWGRAALECVHRGISVSRIISGMSDGFDLCADVLRKCSISTDGLGAVKSDSCTTTSRGLGLQMSKKPIMEDSRASHHLSVGHKTLNTGGHRKIKLSRHFCQPESKNVSTAPQPHQFFNVGHIAEGLSHGCVQAMNLVVEAVKLQSKTNQDLSCSTFDVTKVVTCVVPGLPEEHACVLPGCIVLLSDEQAAVAHHLKEQHLKVALINGDLSHAFRHLGFSRPAGVQRVSEQLALSSDKEEVWMVKVVALLLNLEANLILVSGLASEKVIQHCCGRRVLVVEKVKASIFKAFADATAGVPVTYATQLTKHCVGTGVKVEIWRDLGGGSERKSSTAVNISTGGNSGLFTVILTSCIRGKLQALEDQFWACAYRLHHALKDRAVLPGAGATEMLCIRRLRQRAVSAYSTQESEAGGAADLDRGVVLHLMADGLIDYISTVMVNTGRVSKVRARTVVSQQLQERNGHVDIAARLSQLVLEGENEDSDLKSNEAPEMDVYDNLSVKQEAWRKALDLLFLVLQTDAEVITGVDLTTGAQGNLMLL